MNKINGIIVSGNVYTLTDRRGWNCSPFDCDLYAICHKDDVSYRNRPCQIYDEDTGFRLNKELTDKLKQYE